MGCYKPLQAYQSTKSNSVGKRVISFSPNYNNEPIQLPCGQCIGCRLERSRQWAMRCVHEASLYQHNCFITLTFNNESLSKRGTKSLIKRDFQLFIKKLRKQYGSGIRFYQCGEYGAKFKRPHYHACIFNFDFPDKRLWKRGAHPLYRSPSLERLWPYGYSSIGEVNFETAAYVARYILKKINGPQKTEHYSEINYETGEVTHEYLPEYTTMSRRPGIGRNWFLQWKDDVFPRDKVVLRGQEMRPPRYYDTIFEHLYPQDFEEIKKKRLDNIQERLFKEEAQPISDRPPTLESRERVATLNNLSLRRAYENGT